LCLICAACIREAASPIQNLAPSARIDHLIYAAPSLELGVARVEALTGIYPVPGGSHPGRGTRNALIALGPDSYLEIMAPDPAQPPPAIPRPFGMDAMDEPHLVGWVAKASDIERTVAQARTAGIDLGAIVAMSRRRPDGVLLSWRLTLTSSPGGPIPSFIDWGASPHPSSTAPKGARLLRLQIETRRPQDYQHVATSLHLPVTIVASDHEALVATLATPRGIVELR
jgi:hypothetical protein